MALIEFKNVDFSYILDDDESDYSKDKATAASESKEIKVLENLNLSIEKGSFVAVLGHNGSGKSTIAKLTNGILFPKKGQVLVDGQETKDDDSIFDIRKKVGMVFQNPDNQIVSTIVEEDVAFGPENLGVPPDEIRRRVDESLKAVGLEGFGQRAPNMLSGGQKQREAIAGVLAMHPDIIVFDEPTAMLDPKGRKEVIRAVRALNDVERITVILITHYMEEVIYADKVFVMDKGKITLQGTPREVFSEVERLKELRLDVPQVTLLAHELRKEGFPIPEGILTKEELRGALDHCVNELL